VRAVDRSEINNTNGKDASALNVVILEIWTTFGVRLDARPTPPDVWGRKLRDKKDYGALAAVYNSRDYSEKFQKWKKQDVASELECLQGLGIKRYTFCRFGCFVTTDER